MICDIQTLNGPQVCKGWGHAGFQKPKPMYDLIGLKCIEDKNGSYDIRNLSHLTQFLRKLLRGDFCRDSLIYLLNISKLKPIFLCSPPWTIIERVWEADLSVKSA